MHIAILLNIFGRSGSCVLVKKSCTRREQCGMSRMYWKAGQLNGTSCIPEVRPTCLATLLHGVYWLQHECVNTRGHELIKIRLNLVHVMSLRGPRLRDSEPFPHHTSCWVFKTHMMIVLMRV